MKHIRKREIFLEKYKEQILLESGPLSNDIHWGDSLIGRLFASISRMAKMGIDLKRIDGLLARLERAITDNVYEEVKDKDVFKETESIVKKESSKERLREIIMKDPSKLEKYLDDTSDEFGEDYLLGIFKDLPEEFLMLLEELIKKSESGEMEKTSTDVDTSKSDSNKSSSIYPIMVQNLKYLSSVLTFYSSVSIEGENNNNSKQSEQKPEQNKGNQKVSDKPVVSINKNPEEKKDFSFNNRGVEKGFSSTTNVTGVNQKVEAEKMTESYVGQTKQVIKKNETHLIQAFKNLRAAIGVLISSKEKGIGIDVKFLNDLVSGANDSDNKVLIKRLYFEIYDYLAGSKKSAISTNGELYKESIDVLSNKQKTQIVAEKIARFTKRASQFDKENLYGGLGDRLGTNLQKFVEGMKKIVNHFKENKKEEPKKENTDIKDPKKETELTQAQSNEVTKVEESLINEKFEFNFLSKLFSGDKFNGISANSISGSKIKLSGKGNTMVININGDESSLKDILDKYLPNKDRYVENSVRKAEKELDSVVKDLEKKMGYVIDPLEIVRIFNDANRIMTKNEIPSVRSGGKVSNSRFNNWEGLSGDGGTHDNPKGPFRNIKLFHKWNDGVLVIMKKYKKELQSAEFIDGDGKKYKPKYPITKFMTDALEDNKLFLAGAGRGDGAGYQKKYLMEYFGIDEKKFEGDRFFKTTTSKEKYDRTENIENGIISFVKAELPIKSKSMFKQVYKLNGKFKIGDEKERRSLYVMLYHRQRGGYIGYLSGSDSFVKGFVDGYKPKDTSNTQTYLIKFNEDGVLKKDKISKNVLQTVSSSELKGTDTKTLLMDVVSIEELKKGDKSIELDYDNTKISELINRDFFKYYVKQDSLDAISNKLS